MRINTCPRATTCRHPWAPCWSGLNVQSAAIGGGQMVAVTRPVTPQSSGPKPPCTGTIGTPQPFINRKRCSAIFKRIRSDKRTKKHQKLSRDSLALADARRIVEGFRCRTGNQRHRYRVRRGTVYAASGGKVSMRGSAIRGYGKCIILKHDVTTSRLMLHDELRVKERG